MPDVLILGGRAPVALDHARRFAHQGWRVHVGDSVSFRLSGSSHSVKGTVSLPPPRYQGSEFCSSLTRYVTDHRIDLLVPTCEEVFFVARYRSSLPQQLTVATDAFETLRRLHSKITFLEEARSCGVTTPDSTAVRTLDEARAWAGNRPCVIKPEYSRFGVFVRIYPRGIPRDAPALESMGRWVVQDYCRGTEICSYSIAAQGRLVAHQAYHPKYRLGRSSSFYFAPLDVPRIEAFVRTIVAKTNFTGQLSFDWMRGADGTCTVLECNPRATSGLHLFAPDDAIPAALAGTAQTLVKSSRSQPRMLSAIMATTGLWQATRRGQVAEWRRDFASATDVLIVPGDRRPVVGALRDLGSYLRVALRERCSMREAATRDIEWDGQTI